jgi:hypothetical protein
MVGHYYYDAGLGQSSTRPAPRDQKQIKQNSFRSRRVEYMTNRTFLTLGLLVTLSAVAPSALRAEGTTMKWSAGTVPSSSGSAEEAAQLARQASELAARAAQMAAAAQNGSLNATSSAPVVSAATSAPAATTISAPSTSAHESASQEWRGNGQSPKVLDIRFQDGATATATDIPLPVIEPVATTTHAPVLAAAAVATQVPPAADNQVRQAARTYTDASILRLAQVEPVPAAPGSPQPTAAPQNGYGTANGNGVSSDPMHYDGGMYGDACCPPQRVLFWTAGMEATFLTPDLNSSGGTTLDVEDIQNDRYDVFSSQSNDVDSLYLSPRVWLGIQGCLWGANLRYWHLYANEGAYDPTIGSFNTWDDYDCGVPDIGYFTTSTLEAYTVDLEITRRFCLHDCWMQAAVGLRHAELEASESITGLGLTDDGLLSGYGRANRYTRGTGILLGLYGRKPLFPCSSVNWFYNVRWSAVWGPTHTSAETFAAVQAGDDDFTASAASVNGAYTCVDDTLFIGEVQLGLEWNYALVCMPANAFFRVALEYQRWDGGSGFSGANSFAGITLDGDTEANSIISTSASAPAPQMDLIGFTIGTGLTW